MTKGWRVGVAVAAIVATAPGCYGIRVAASPSAHPGYRAITRPAVAPDDLDLPGIRHAVLATRSYFDRAPADARFTLGRDVYTAEQVARSVEYFAGMLESTPVRLLDDRIARECRGYSPAGGARFTAYYEPILRARRRPDARFRYPLYRMPDAATLASRPRPTRAQIDGDRILGGRGLELAWVDDPVALYFLHVQGSGRLQLEDGTTLRVNYAGNNGHPYRSVGRYLLDTGLITAGSAGAIRTYLSTNPHIRDHAMFQNPRYIFFREVSLGDGDGPIGSLGVPLVAGRSIAADPRYVPPGAVAYIRTQTPVVDTRGKLVGWNRMARFVFNHDSGAAIKGPGRADIFWGKGDRAGLAAGYVNGPGQMVVLICGVGPQGTAARANGLVPVTWPRVDRVLAAR